MTTRELSTRLLAQTLIAGCLGFALVKLANSSLVFESPILWVVGHDLAGAVGILSDAVPAIGVDLDDLVALVAMYLVATLLVLAAMEGVYRASSAAVDVGIRRWA